MCQSLFILLHLRADPSPNPFVILLYLFYLYENIHFSKHVQTRKQACEHARTHAPYTHSITPPSNLIRTFNVLFISTASSRQNATFYIIQWQDLHFQSCSTKSCSWTHIHTLSHIFVQKFYNGRLSLSNISTDERRRGLHKRLKLILRLPKDRSGQQQQQQNQHYNTHTHIHTYIFVIGILLT